MCSLFDQSLTLDEILDMYKLVEIPDDLAIAESEANRSITRGEIREIFTDGADEPKKASTSLFLPRILAFTSAKSDVENVAVITSRKNQPRALERMRWGLVRAVNGRKPKKDGTLPAEPTNARGDNLNSTWKFLLASHRCVIPAHAWSEKFGIKGMKDTAWFESRTGAPMFFGALTDTWQKPDGSLLHTVTMVTTEPNGMLGDYHDRAPWVIPNQDTFDIWMDNDRFDSAELVSLVMPADPGLVRIREIIKADTKMSRALAAKKANES